MEKTIMLIALAIVGIPFLLFIIILEMMRLEASAIIVGLAYLALIFGVLRKFN